jgi:hypothetical protein
MLTVSGGGVEISTVTIYIQMRLYFTGKKLHSFKTDELLHAFCSSYSIATIVHMEALQTMCVEHHCEIAWLKPDPPPHHSLANTAVIMHQLSLLLVLLLSVRQLEALLGSRLVFRNQLVLPFLFCFNFSLLIMAI